MKKYLAAATAALTLSATACAAQPPKDKPAYDCSRDCTRSEHLPHGFDRLDLSSRQKAKIRKILENERRERQAERSAHEEKMKAKFASLEAQHEERIKKEAERQAAVDKLISGKKFDEAAARRLIGEEEAESDRMIADMNADRAEHKPQHEAAQLRRLKNFHAMFQVLTPKQQQQWLEQRKQRAADKAERRKPRPETPEADQHPEAPQTDAPPAFEPVKPATAPQQ
ncbi:Spy/CpxP family protein refolding chaperone [Neisseria chenwenguii]|uniref:Uncharacterized protein n=1 Tax=Neisseria chenwenguii TaxID=1853278 RepID=A0A220S1Z0_9NEIS|nr:hypothetical protein [Neisseria chenwenguii]ASK27494.1 hypothetical protein BG910_06815 [Neisseria chenwenguii]ROV55574.1 hypothetical protein EGS38_08660 [Neisseria chenwenguii]